MKNTIRLLASLLCFAMLIPFVSCDNGGSGKSTEAPTDAPTSPSEDTPAPDTDAPTEPETEAPTEAPTDAATEPAPAGCRSALPLSLLPLLLGAAYARGKKKK